ncbi:hypothetical protein GGX14DRAFT_321479, partial [Mycena pura]
YTAYSQPPASTPYSAKYFQQLTFHDASSQCYPTIYPCGTIGAWCFAEVLPRDTDTLISPGESIPNIADITPILASMKDAFSAGSCSVLVTLHVGSYKLDRIYHFRKLELIRQVNNHHDAVQSAREMVWHISSNALLSGQELKLFLLSSILTPISGFGISSFPLWKLSCLLNEAWLHEDVLNALAEMLYF